MKARKRMIALALSALLMCSNSIVAFAEDGEILNGDFTEESTIMESSGEELTSENGLDEDSVNDTNESNREIEDYGIQTYSNVTLHWPVPGHTRLSQGYHDGGCIDISDGSIGGARVVAAMGGTVTNIWLCGQQHSGSYGDCNGYGTGLVILGDDGRYYKYAHMQAGSIPATAYRTCRVEAGQTIGAVGTTGNSTGNHLHFGITTGSWYNNSGINPANENYIYDSVSVPTQTTVKFEGERCEWDTTNAFVYTKLTTSTTGHFTGAGLRVWDMNNNLVASKDEATNITLSWMEIYYNIHDETGVYLKDGMRYKYQMYGDYNGQRYWTDMRTFITNTIAPGTVNKINAYTAGNRKVSLNWNGVSGASGYLIYARKNGKYAYCGITNGTSFTDSQALNDDWNFYWVYAYKTNSDGKRTVGKCAKYTYAKGYNAAATNVRASSVSNGVKISWNKAGNTTGYLIYGRVNGGKYSYVGMTSGNTYTDKKASKNVYSFYWVIPYKMNSLGKRVTGTTSKYVYGKAK